MSAKWMRIETDFVDHPKVYRLAQALQSSPADAGWYVMRALSWLSRFCPTGQVRDIDGTSLELSCQWSGGSGELVAALLVSGWLETWDNDGTRAGWEWHDWPEHQGRVADKAAKERERKRAYRAKKAAEASSHVPRDNDGTRAGTNTGRPAQRDVTGRDVTGRDVEEKKAPLPLTESPALQLLVAPPPTPVEQLRGAWNEHRGEGLPEWRESGKRREKAAQARLRERALDEWVAIIKRIASSAFCRGTNDRGWRADPDWLLKPDTASKVLEGKYDNRTTKSDLRAPVAAEAVQWKPEDAGEVQL